MHLKQFLKKNWFLVLAILYVLSPIDFLPDFLGPLGYSDDVLVLILTALIKYIQMRKGHKDGKDVIEGEIVD